MENEKKKISKVLDELHDAAAKNDAERYFSLYTEDAVFLGTDPEERWDMPAMKAWAIPRFKAGRGWTYFMETRFIRISEDLQTAWFDETLINDNLGECRGSGALIQLRDDWKITQYNLTIPIPNNIVLDVVKMIRHHKTVK